MIHPQTALAPALAPAFAPQGKDTARDITKLIVMAVGGQGGGVLINWIEAVARAEGRAVQATSVAGVAQRTGATIYYVEIAPAGLVAPIFSLAPAAGDVDILIAAELMEAGRAIQRGFVTPDRTALILSEHRALAVSEKMAPGNGIAKADDVIGACRKAASKLIMADMEKLAVEQGSVISASLLGALAASAELPFPRESYEEAIRASTKGVDASLRAFAAGFEAASTPTASQQNVDQSIEKVTALPFNGVQATGPEKDTAAWDEVQSRVRDLPEAIQDMASRGLQKVVLFQNCKYGEEYLSRLESIVNLDSAQEEYELSLEAAKHIANAMAYDDVIRVADIKTSLARKERIDTEMDKSEAQLLKLTEYFHPRAEEIAGMLPAGLGARVDASPKWMARLDRWFNKGRRIRTDRVSGFLQMYLLAGLRGYRPRTHRHQIEQHHLNNWLEQVVNYRAFNYELAAECLRCRRLIKGYSDTHVRGLSKFDKVMEGIAQISKRKDAANLANQLREAALKDADGVALDHMLKTIQ